MELTQDKEFATMLERHGREIVEHLIKRGTAFSILCNIKKVFFDPMLPELEKLPQFSLFVLAGYTFDSIEVGKDFLNFEAGFGKKNEGSFVTVPFSAIVRIALYSDMNIAETVLFTNMYASLEETNTTGVADSMRAFFENPENQHLRK